MPEGRNNYVDGSQPRRRGWRWFLQFNLRTLLLLVTAAAIGCWWFLQPQTREEQLGGMWLTPLVMKRQVRVVKYELPKPTGISRPAEVIVERGERFQIVNDGRWRLYDPKGNLLVDGFYKSDRPQGKWTIYHANGRKAAEGKMKDGRKVGLWKTWDEEGRVIGEAAYAEGEEEQSRGDEIPRLPEWNMFMPPVVGMIG
jgi:hypothetical protein